LELFRLSLFVTDYAEIAKKVRLFFSVAIDEERLHTDFDLVWKENHEQNGYIPYFVFSENYLKSITEVNYI